jgi:hypothetical protein
MKDWKQYCVDENFVGIGSTRKVYRVADCVIKVHMHPIGYKQSVKELEIYKWMVEGGLDDLFAETCYVDECISVQKYVKPLEKRNHQAFEIDSTTDQHLLPEKYEEVLKILDKQFDSFDLKDSDNYGLDTDNKLVFIDYGMTRKLYEEEWVPLAESGIIRKITIDTCTGCGIEKELRMYGDDDTDKRCYECGKE